MSKRKADAPPRVESIPEVEDTVIDVNALPTEETNICALVNNKAAVEENVVELGSFWVLLNRAGYMVW